MEIPCPTCGTPAPADGVDWNRRIARCRRCGSLFDISDKAEGAPSALQRRRAPVPMPATFTVIEGAAIVDLPELGGSARLREAGLPLFTLVDFAGH